MIVDAQGVCDGMSGGSECPHTTVSTSPAVGARSSNPFTIDGIMEVLAAFESDGFPWCEKNGSASVDIPSHVWAFLLCCQVSNLYQLHRFSPLQDSLQLHQHGLHRNRGLRAQAPAPFGDCVKTTSFTIDHPHTGTCALWWSSAVWPERHCSARARCGHLHPCAVQVGWHRHALRPSKEVCESQPRSK
jgi:hypothetical protein